MNDFLRVGECDPFPCGLATQSALGRRAALLKFACAGALLAPPRADAETDVLGSYKLVELLTDAKDLGGRRERERERE